MKRRLQWHKGSLIWLFLSVLSLSGTIYFTYHYIKVHKQLLSDAQAAARKETMDVSHKLDSFINMLKPITQSVASIIGSKAMDIHEIEQLLKKKKPVEITGLGVAFLPYQFNPNIKLYAPYYLEQDGKLQLIQLNYDYTLPQYKWFAQTITDGPGFREPYYGEASKTILAEYNTPIYRVNEKGQKEIIGVVFASQSVEHLSHILDTLFLGQKGYWTIITKEGHFLTHPREQLVHQQKTIFDLAKELNNPKLAQIGKKIIQKESVFLEYNNEITGAPSWLFSESINGTDWSIVGVFDKSELATSNQLLRHNLIYPFLMFTLFIIMLTLFIFSLFTTNHTARWWIATIIISLALFGQIIWVWYVTYLYPHYHVKQITHVQNKTDLYSYLKQEATLFRYGQKIESNGQKNDQKDINVLTQGYYNRRYIPTGIFVNNIQFTSANEIQISAFVWQRFTDTIHDKIPRGFILPQATDAEIYEVSRTKEGNTEVILYTVFAKLNQFLQFETYPFDTKALQIQLLHTYSKENIILVPDLDSYQLINPRALPGIDNDVSLPGWHLVATQFGYKKINYSSNLGVYAIGPFGIYKSTDKSEIPELYFEMLVSRKLLDTLVADLLPIAVIAVLLFIILLTSTQQKYAIIGSLASVFFATIFSHLRLRGFIPQSEVVYFESFYFLMYAMILFILTVSMAYTMGFDIAFIRYRQNFIAKLMYWPLLLASLSLITLWYLL